MTAALIILSLTVAMLVAVLVLVTAEDRRRNAEAIALIDRLCQRIQAPHAAILEHDEAVRGPISMESAPPAVLPDDDADYWASRDKLAETLMDREVNGG